MLPPSIALRAFNVVAIVIIIIKLFGVIGRC